ncbi:uncharacterized protein LOC117639383 [Thrips palmi]|uniref:Uncharacterized protein LOC117639383 n=1 Tax=Thrips palmi TaxID=161013 RepID=A0A6P8Y3J2_THRPL|nr:uncharacterized protein LOC117639383 [Thrips palmi]
MARCSARAVALLVLVVLSVLVPPGSTCFHSLRRPPYETYWLGTYYESRFLSLTCFALRGFRWTLKFIKVTYESWHVEMEYARCISDTYGMNIPFMTPPWGKNARLLMNESEESAFQRMESRQSFQELPLGVPLTDRVDKLKKSDMKVSYTVHRWDDKNNIKEIMTSLQPILGNNKLSEINFLTTNEKESMKEIMRVAQSLYKIMLSVYSEFEALFSRTLGNGIFSCTKKYVKHAFWRWIDSAPFLR